MSSGGYAADIARLEAEITALQTQIAAGGEDAAALTAQLESKTSWLSRVAFSPASRPSL